ncbi:hypothetical protein C5C31_09495 [Rathayibacter rathayi]|uniref:hypothetical protein n=1 Tax=Rathayibacter rathayi TaxID=33887 RepID=UPI000BD38397|nr:hypothetical protein [Rathayibacter rathayi]AZZ49856.1 hypothetical protein C1O28_12225 [Rathayibacter rathayi]MWV75633.1 hypothetical protein [Rathayibacter rathayi NCPPB 2980 = VKM Ac-1601]PPG66469.1 hypothetical protein C5C16_11115 [Rathayibacter rathayi]PPG75623.1 hypothetical protein C5C15_12485 [Rathayibacter rathayi]PPH22035.1 hypothetical protein C5C31_09495 [Rathayibacter rathayi]
MTDPLTRSMPLHGASAQHWLKERGSQADADPAFTLVGHETSADGVLLRRLWHTPGSIRFRPTAGPDPSSLVLLLPLEGVFSVTCGQEQAIVRHGSVAALPAGSSGTISTSAPSSRLVLMVRPAGVVGRPHGLSVSSSPAVPVLLAVANALLDAGLPIDDGLQTALEGLAASVLVV